MSVWASTAVLFLGLAAPTAAASETTFRVLDDGTLEATMTVDAEVEELRAVIANPKVRHDLSADVYSVDVRPEGRCKRLDTKTRGMFRPLAVASLFCPTDKGFKESLVSSSDFSSYEQEWSFVSAGGGKTEVIFRTNSVPNLPVPTSVLRANTKQSVDDMFGKLVLRVIAGR